MRKKKIQMAFVGAVIAFVWYSFSWVVIGAPVKNFVSQDNMVGALKENAMESGIYYLPPMNVKTEAEKQAQMQLMQQGPVMFAAIQTNGVRSLGLSMALSIVTQFVGAYGIACMLVHRKESKYGKKVLFVAGIGFLVAWLGYMPSWIWRGFSTEYTLFCMVDILIAWTLAGLAMAKLSK